MLHTGFAPFVRLTALSALASLLGLTLAPLAQAQQAAASAAVAAPAKAPPAKAEKKVVSEKKAEAPAKGKAADTKAADASKGPDKKTRDAARKAYGQGEKAFNEGKFAEAQEAFQKANDLIPSPHAQFWIAKSLEKEDKVTEAIQAYQSFLANPDAARTGEDKLADAKTRIDELGLRLIAVVELVTSPPQANVAVDGNPETGASPHTLKLAPGPHKIVVSAPGYDMKEVALDAKAGDKLNQSIELAVKPPPPPPPPVAEPEPVAPPPPPPPAEKRSMTPAYVTVGVAGAAAVVGAIFGAQALSSKNAFNKNPTTKHADDTERNALISDMAFGVAITLGVTGIVLLTSDDDAPKESARNHLPKVDFDAYAGKTGGGASARWHF